MSTTPPPTPTPTVAAAIVVIPKFEQQVNRIILVAVRWSKLEEDDPITEVFSNSRRRRG